MTRRHRAPDHLFVIVILLSLSLGLAAPAVAEPDVTGVTQPDITMVDDPSPPSQPIKLVFVHHSCGSNWLADGNGNLGIALRDSNYFVSDTNYGWGPDGIGNSTDIGHWWTWFVGPSRDTYTAALYAQSGKMSSYSRLATDPGGENEIIMFKSCYPNSNLLGEPDDPATTGDNPLRGVNCGSSDHTVGNAKGIYNDLLTYFSTRQDKLFIVITAPPLVASYTNAENAANARAFNNWLVNDWLDGYPHSNVAVFDFYNVLTSNGGSSGTTDLGWATGNHHRWYSSSVQHIHTVDNDYAAYGASSTNSHPNSTGNQKATGEFVNLLNVYVNRWQGSSGTQQSIALETGWNLASLAVAPYDTAIASVLASVAGHYDIAIRYEATSDTWHEYDPASPGGSTLTTLDETTAFWIRMTQDDTLTVAGDVPGTTNQSLVVGWNMVSYPSQQSRALPQALSSIDGDYEAVYGYAAGTASPWQLYAPDSPDWASELENLDAGQGYWIKATSACTLSIEG